MTSPMSQMFCFFGFDYIFLYDIRRGRSWSDWFGGAIMWMYGVRIDLLDPFFPSSLCFLLSSAFHCTKYFDE